MSWNKLFKRKYAGTLTIERPDRHMKESEARSKFRGRHTEKSEAAIARLCSKPNVVRVPGHAIRQLWKLTGGWHGDWHAAWLLPEPMRLLRTRLYRVNNDLSVIISVPLLEGWIQWRGEIIAHAPRSHWLDLDGVHQLACSGTAWWPQGFDWKAKRAQWAEEFNESFRKKQEEADGKINLCRAEMKSAKDNISVFKTHVRSAKKATSWERKLNYQLQLREARIKLKSAKAKLKDCRRARRAIDRELASEIRMLRFRGGIYE